jgi:hypothetical protein
MRRRDIIAAGTAAALAATASSASASDTPPPAEGLALNIAGVGLPVIVGGRVRNYVFVTVKLHLGGGQTPETFRAKDPFFRDALVRTAHRVPFVVPGDWTRLNENAINAAMMAMAPIIAGEGSVVRSEVAMQAARRRTGVPGG